MDFFRWIAVVLSTILGLGIARILSGFVTVFKARDRVAPDWLSLILAGVILGEFLQFWWALAELAKIKSWSLGDFTLLTALAMALFLAAALIVPDDIHNRDPKESFEKDGRWSLAAIGIYYALGIFANCTLWAERLLSPSNALLALLVILATLGFLGHGRRVRVTVVALFAALNIADTFIASQSVYGG